MWWKRKTNQPFHMESMRAIYAVLNGYLAEKSRESLIKEFPDAVGFISRAYDWLGPVSQLTEVQKLMMDRMLLTIDFFTNTSDTVPCSLISDEQMEALVKELFEEGGQGAHLDLEISKKENLTQIYAQWKPEYSENLERLEDPRKKELYKTCCAIASGVSDCHHNTFRYIESWIHDIGIGHSGIPTRRAGTERERLGRLLFGHVLGLDKWLSGVPMQFLLLDLGHIDLGFDPRNEILRVYAYLGEERTPVKEWLAACLWHNLTYSPIDAANPCGLIRHKDLLDRAAQAGISLREWMDSQLQGSTGSI
jgi:hypothetical protein